MNRISMGLRQLVAGAVLFWAGSAMAVSPIQSCTVNSITPDKPTGCDLMAMPPATAGGDAFNDNFLHLWVESKNFTLSSALMADWVPMMGSNPIPAGTRIASVGIQFDPLREHVMDAEVTFSRKILGVVWSRKNLVASDYLLPTTIFLSPVHRGLELSDIAGTTISSNGLSFIWTSARPGDNIRVILSAIPEPTTWAMLIGGFGMVGFAARRQRNVMAA